MTERRVLLGRGSFVGRSDEMRSLVDGLESTLQGRGEVALIGGEPGSGKTRLAEELTGVARKRGFRVAWGRCWEDGGAPAYWPWAQCIRSLLRREGSGVSVAADLAAIAPDLQHEAEPSSATADPEAARFRLFDAAARFFHSAASEQPLALVLDDLHAADEPSLLLLRFLARDIGDVRLLVLGTYRDTAALPGDPLAETLGELARHGTPRRLALGGLEREDIARYVTLTAGTEPHPDLVAAIQAETDGNALYVTELVRLLASEGRLDQGLADRAAEVPTGVREAIAGRLRQLPDRCRAVLTVASVVGRDFDLGTLGRATGLGPDELLEAFDEAVMSRIVVESPGSAGRLRFAHAVVRDAIYDSVPSAKRVRLHARIAEILERHLGEPDRHLSEIAHHSLRAAPVIDAARAVEHVRRAGDQAMGLLAWEEAVRWYDGALQLADRNATRCELLLSKGDALVKAGAFPRAQEVFLEAWALAGSMGSPMHVARAALGYGGRFAWLRAGHDSRLIPMLEEALSALGEDDADLRVRLMSRLSGAMRDDPDRGPREARSRDAVDMARRLGDPDSLAYALVARYTAIWGPDNGDELLEIATEVVDLGKRRGDRDRLLEGTLLRHKALMQLGDLRSARVELATAERLTEELRQPAQRWYVAADRAALALLEARLDDAEGLIDEALEVGGEAQRMEAQSTRVLQLWALRREQGRLPEVEELVRHGVDEFPWYPLFRCLLANVEAELGKDGPARAVLEELVADGVRAIPVDNEWLFAMALLAEPVAALEEHAAAEVLYGLLIPFEGLNAYSAPELSLGAVDRSLGILAATLGRWDDADRHLDAAARVNERMEANAWLVRSRHDHARMLLARGRPGDGERAASMAAAAQATANGAGMRDMEGKLAELASSGAKAATSAGHVFRKEGEYWSVAFEGRGFRLRDTKGLHYLAALLAAPGREIHAMDLLTARAVNPADIGAARDAGLAPGTPDGGEDILDARARDSYRRRLAELEEEIEEAEAWSDPERAARASEEREAIVEQLAAATGLGGRSRKTASAAERARVNITRSIRSAMARIAEHDPDLGRHLERTLNTGTFCSYAPDPRAPVAWDTAPVPPG